MVVIGVTACGGGADDAGPPDSAVADPASSADVAAVGGATSIPPATVDTVVDQTATETTTETTTETATTTETVAPSLELGASLTMFGPVSEPPADKLDWPLPKGSSDYYDLFDDDAAWAGARDLLGASRSTRGRPGGISPMTNSSR